MATFNPITITNAGEDILAQAVAGDGTLTFTAVSSSSDKESGDLKNITELQNVRQTVAPVIAILEDNTIQLSAVFSNSGLSQGYVVNTLGIYAKIGSEAPVLFAIATATDPDTVPGQNPISPSNFYYQFNIAITDDSNITVSIPEEGSLPASVFYQKFGSANISQIGDGTVTGAITQNANVAGGDRYDSSKSYAAGDYFIHNDQLCKALTAIASGAALTPGNNYQVTSLENEISGLNRNNAGAHNSIYRGKNLGNAVTDAQWQAISSGTFIDLYIGDYWVIGGVNWRIAAFDYYYNCGDTNFTKHHAVIVPDTALYTHVMNDTNITTGAYVGSKMYTEGMEQAKTTINNAFGSSHVLSHRIYLSNATSNGKASAGAWTDSTVDLMCEHMVYGSGIFSPVSDGSTVPSNYRVEKSQLPLFAHNPRMIVIRSAWWLRDVISSAGFAYVNNGGGANYAYASYACGVRPAFCIGI